MRLPVKLNRGSWPELLRALPITQEDPRPLATRLDLTPDQLSRCLSVLKIGTTFKTTHHGRHRLAHQLIVELTRGQRPVVLDIGASDGSTSLDLIRTLGPSLDTYYVTDRDTEVLHGVDERGTSFFRDLRGACILRVSDRWIVYRDVAGAPPPIAWLARWLIAAERRVASWRAVSLFQPELIRAAEADDRIRVLRHDMFDPWREKPPTVVKIANVLNRAYFSDAEITRALRSQHAALAEGGYLVLVDNRDDQERVTGLRRTPRGFEEAGAAGGGCEVASLALRMT